MADQQQEGENVDQQNNSSEQSPQPGQEQQEQQQQSEQVGNNADIPGQTPIIPDAEQEHQEGSGEQPENHPPVYIPQRRNSNGNLLEVPDVNISEQGLREDDFASIINPVLAHIPPVGQGRYTGDYGRFDDINDAETFGQSPSTSSPSGPSIIRPLDLSTRERGGVVHPASPSAATTTDSDRSVFENHAEYHERLERERIEREDRAASGNNQAPNSPFPEGDMFHNGVYLGLYPDEIRPGNTIDRSRYDMRSSSGRQYDIEAFGEVRRSPQSASRVAGPSGARRPQEQRPAGPQSSLRPNESGLYHEGLPRVRNTFPEPSDSSDSSDSDDDDDGHRRSGGGGYGSGGRRSGGDDGDESGRCGDGDGEEGGGGDNDPDDDPDDPPQREYEDDKDPQKYVDQVLRPVNKLNHRINLLTRTGNPNNHEEWGLHQVLYNHFGVISRKISKYEKLSHDRFRWMVMEILGGSHENVPFKGRLTELVDNQLKMADDQLRIARTFERKLDTLNEACQGINRLVQIFQNQETGLIDLLGRMEEAQNRDLGQVHADMRQIIQALHLMLRVGGEQRNELAAQMARQQAQQLAQQGAQQGQQQGDQQGDQQNEEQHEEQHEQQPEQQPGQQPGEHPGPQPGPQLGLQPREILRQQVDERIRQRQPEAECDPLKDPWVWLGAPKYTINGLKNLYNWALGQVASALRKVWLWYRAFQLQVNLVILLAAISLIYFFQPTVEGVFWGIVSIPMYFANLFRWQRFSGAIGPGIQNERIVIEQAAFRDENVPVYEPELPPTIADDDLETAEIEYWNTLERTLGLPRGALRFGHRV